MKRIVMMLFLLGVVRAGMAQEIALGLDNFTKITINSGLKVTLTHSQENQILVTGNSSDKVTIHIEDGTLVLDSQLRQLLNIDDTRVEVLFKELRELQVAQHSSVDFATPFKQPFLKMEVSESAKLSISVEVNELLANLYTGGSVQISGTAKNQHIEVRTAGEFKGGNLKGEAIFVKLNRDANAEVFSNNYINANVSRRSSLMVLGNPEKIDKKTTFGGSVVRIN